MTQTHNDPIILLYWHLNLAASLDFKNNFEMVVWLCGIHVPSRLSLVLFYDLRW